MMQTILIAALLLTPPAAADPFCDTLTRVIAAVPGKFETLARGDEVEAKTYDVDAQIDPSAFRCVIKTGDPGPPFYQCTARQDTKPGSGDAEALAERAGKCAGVPFTPRDRMDGWIPRNSLYLAKLPGATIAVGYDTVTTTGIVTVDPSATMYFTTLRVFPAGR